MSLLFYWFKGLNEKCGGRTLRFNAAETKIRHCVILIHRPPTTHLHKIHLHVSYPSSLSDTVFSKI
jgi:hypothetical protein